jgi:hypothetical protein
MKKSPSRRPATHRTTAGRVVYDRKKHLFKPKDAARIIIAVSGTDFELALLTVVTVLKLFFQLISKKIKYVPSYIALRLLEAIVNQVLRELLAIAGKDIKWLAVDLIGYKPPVQVPSTNIKV